MARTLTPEQREQIAADAARRYTAGESWQDIGATYGITGDHVRRLTIVRHDITYHRWGQRPIADPRDVARRRKEGQTLDQIAEDLGCSRQAVRTALEAAGTVSATRYPRLSQRRDPTPEELAHVRALYESCPPAPRNRPGTHDVRGPEGRAVAQACHDIVVSGVPMQVLARALGRGHTWVHWLLGVHNLRPQPHSLRSTARRTRSV